MNTHVALRVDTKSQGQLWHPYPEQIADFGNIKLVKIVNYSDAIMAIFVTSRGKGSLCESTDVLNALFTQAHFDICNGI